jgi:hypothetical protein
MEARIDAVGRVIFTRDYNGVNIELFAIAIEIEPEGTEALWPEKSHAREEVHGTGAWIAAEAKRMKAAGEIRPDITISDFARALGHRMEEEAVTNKSLHPIKWRSIKNKLPEWALWPIDSIK